MREQVARAGELRSSARDARAAMWCAWACPPGGALILALGVALAGGAARPAAGDIHVGFADPALVVAPGDTFTTWVVVRKSDAAFNAFDASVRFDSTMLRFEPIAPEGDQPGVVMTSACANIFHRFHAAPDSLRITLSLLCSRTNVTGPGRLYGVRFRAGLLPGTTTLSLGPSTEFYRAGLFARPLHRRDLIVTIALPAAAGSKRAPSVAPATSPTDSR